MNFNFKQNVLPLLFLILASLGLQAQVTTATINGSVNSDEGMLVGATVVAIHTPTGTQYGTTTRGNGGYTLPNLKVGGPYTIVVSYIGKDEQKKDNIFISLAQKLTINFDMQSGGVTLDEIVVSGKSDPILNGERTGASTNISIDQLQKLPTISRSTQDFYRLEPSSTGSSFGGRNNKMNNFTLDGSIFNNPFGLDAATPGSQSNAQPVSLDAIEQIQVNIAPYDVTQSGFTGAAVNAVTKSGTNEFKGSVYGFYRNQDLTGSKVSGVKIDVPDLTHLQTGFSIGGPIIKNKLFFFANAEIERRGDLGTNFVARQDGEEVGGNVSRVLASDMIRVSNALKDRFGYETGAYEGYTHRTDNQKAMFKLDYNLSKSTTVTATYNYLDALRGKPAHPNAIGFRGPNQTTLQFENSGYEIKNKLHSLLGEVKTIFGNSASNFFQIGWTGFRDSRNPFSEPAPTINIHKDGNNYIVVGHEPFSIHNRLNQDVYQITNNFTYYLNNHSITVGASFEKFAFDNSFNLGTFPGVFSPGYVSTDAFLDSLNAGALDAQFAASKDVFEKFGGDDGVLGGPDGLGNGWALAETNVGQFGVYLQDEIAISDKFNLTVGLRVDKPLYFDTEDKIKENLVRAGFNYLPELDYSDEDGNIVHFDQTILPNSKPLFSPRFGFNYDVNGDNSLLVRGGSGLFTGRFPFVWLGNQVANPNWWFYCVTHPEFEFPQVWRNNIGIDAGLGNGLTASIDAVYTKDINAMMVRNYGIKPPTGTLNGVDNRPIYTHEDDANDVIGFGFSNDAYVFTTTDVGRSYNVTLQLRKDFKNGLFTSLGYNYQDSQDASSIPAEISGDAFQRNPAYGNVNKAVLAPSLYGHKHRIVGSASKRFEYGGKHATTIAIFFEYVKGGRFSYTYAGDINNDRSIHNDLIYIPTKEDIGNMAFSGDTQEKQADQRNALEAFIQQDEYMSANRGNVAEKYGVLSPWYNNWDLRIAQDLMFSKKNGLQFTIDILNVGNLISSNWGVRQNPTSIKPIGVYVENGNPTYTFDTDLKNSFTDDFSLLSRWQMQFGLRYSF